MDIWAKHIPADDNGVRIAELDEMSYRYNLWDHTPITDFWRVGHGTARRLASQGMFTMGDIARCSEEDEDLLYRLFGVNAELLIDHAWGWEPCTIQEIKNYKPETNSLSSGQVLHTPYNFAKTRVVVQEMADAVALELVEKQLFATQIILTINYDAESLTNPSVRATYKGEISTDFYGRTVPKHSQGTFALSRPTSSAKLLIEAATSVFDSITNRNLLIRRITISTIITTNQQSQNINKSQQLDLFTDYEAEAKKEESLNAELEKEHVVQETILSIKKKFGKNAILKGLNYQDGATAKERNEQIGGHKA
jgi:DNA polymerase V